MKYLSLNVCALLQISNLSNIKYVLFRLVGTSWTGKSELLWGSISFCICFRALQAKEEWFKMCTNAAAFFDYVAHGWLWKQSTFDYQLKLMNTAWYSYTFNLIATLSVIQLKLTKIQLEVLKEALNQWFPTFYLWPPFKSSQHFWPLAQQKNSLYVIRRLISVRFCSDIFRKRSQTASKQKKMNRFTTHFEF